ncbi:MAG: hypothetical protein O3C57_03480, partial [Verrucomicrobia bacterium]|nr:hypothetical protein [Verrucomicrobiota bacterium]
TAGVLLLAILVAVFSVKLWPNRPRRHLADTRRPEPIVARIVLEEGDEWMADVVRPGDSTYDVAKLSSRIVGANRIVLSNGQTSSVVDVWLGTGRNENGMLMLGPQTFLPGEKFAMPTSNYVLRGTVYSFELAAP